MKPNAFTMARCRRKIRSGSAAYAVTLCLATLMAAPEIVFSKDVKRVEQAGQVKGARGDIRPDSVDSDQGLAGEAAREGARRSTSSSRWRDGSPGERRAMREAARDRWESGSPRDRRIFRRGMSGLRRALPELTEIERLVLLRNLFALPKDERKAMRRRLRGIDRLAQGERKKFVQELRDTAAEPGQESMRIERNVDRWRDLSESERDNYREQMRRFRALSGEDRRRLLDEWERSPEPQP
jgi:hypothetical protein